MAEGQRYPALRRVNDINNTPISSASQAPPDRNSPSSNPFLSIPPFSGSDTAFHSNHPTNTSPHGLYQGNLLDQRLNNSNDLFSLTGGYNQPQNQPENSSPNVPHPLVTGLALPRGHIITVDQFGNIGSYRPSFLDMDFQRPVLASSEGNSIDLTTDTPERRVNNRTNHDTERRPTPSAQRLPRFGHTIINEDNTSDDEVTITESRSRQEVLDDQRARAIDLTGDDDTTSVEDDEDVIHLNTRSHEIIDVDSHPPQGGVNAQRTDTTGGFGTHGIFGAHSVRVQRLLEAQTIGIQHLMRSSGHFLDRARARENNAPTTFGHTRTRYAPGPVIHAMDLPELDYVSTAFNIGYEPQRPQAYAPPRAAAPGFTRNPAVDDEKLVCPNCGIELADEVDDDSTEAEKDLRRQLWVIKSCGHVYCGTCSTTRKGPTSASKSKGKGKEKAVDNGSPPILRKCVVEGCGKSATKNHMIHVYNI